MRTICLTLVLTFTIMAGYAQNSQEVDIKDFTLELKDDGNLSIDIDLDFSKLSVKTTQVVVITPIIVNGDNSLELMSVAVYGRNRQIYYLRNEAEKPTTEKDVVLTPKEAEGTFAYNTSVYFANWMNGCSLELLRTDLGCGGAQLLVDREQLVDKFPIEPYFPELIYLRPEHEVVKTRQINGSAFVDFPVSKTVIYPEYRNNVAELAKITGTIDSVKRDKDITIKSIFIKGYASPESPYSNNTRLAKGRTEALKMYVENMYHFDKGFIKTDYEPEDWAGLERYVEASSLPHKKEILEAIRSDREPDNKEWFIKSRWKKDYRFLLDNCYPALRHSDYTIEYEIRSYSDPVEIEQILHTAPQNLSLEEFFILAQTYEPGSDKFNDLFETAVRMYPHDPVANLNAANSAMLKGDYRSALRYLDKAGNTPEAIYTRGALEVYMERNDAAKPYFEEALELGISQAEVALVEIAKNRNIVTMNKDEQTK